MATHLEVINLAFQHLAMKPSLTTANTTVQMAAALSAWDLALEDTLRAGWSFATVVELLELDSDYTPLSWTYAYKYPDNCLMMWSVYSEATVKGNKDNGEKFRVLHNPDHENALAWLTATAYAAGGFAKNTNIYECLLAHTSTATFATDLLAGDWGLYTPVPRSVIVTNCEDAYGEYTYYVDDPALFDSAFVNAMSHRLAAELAHPLNGDKELAKTEIGIYNALISEAGRLSSVENNDNNQSEGVSGFVDSR